MDIDFHSQRRLFIGVSAVAHRKEISCHDVVRGAAHNGAYC